MAFASITEDPVTDVEITAWQAQGGLSFRAWLDLSNLAAWSVDSAVWWELEEFYAERGDTTRLWVDHCATSGTAWPQHHNHPLPQAFTALSQ